MYECVAHKAAKLHRQLSILNGEIKAGFSLYDQFGTYSSRYFLVVKQDAILTGSQ